MFFLAKKNIMSLRGKRCTRPWQSRLIESSALPNNIITTGSSRSAQDDIDTLVRQNNRTSIPPSSALQPLPHGGRINPPPGFAVPLPGRGINPPHRSAVPPSHGGELTPLTLRVPSPKGGEFALVVSRAVIPRLGRGGATRRGGWQANRHFGSTITTAPAFTITTPKAQLSLRA
jgi:hypothetical protein